MRMTSSIGDYEIRDRCVALYLRFSMLDHFAHREMSSRSSHKQMPRQLARTIIYLSFGRLPALKPLLISQFGRHTQPVSFNSEFCRRMISGRTDTHHS